MAGRADITLSLAVEYQENDRIVNALTREMEQAGRGAGDKAGSAFAGEFYRRVAQEDPRIARAFEKSITPRTRINELSAQAERINKALGASLEDVARKQERLNNLLKDGAASQEEINDAEEAYLASSKERDSLLRQEAINRSQLTRANRDYAQSLRHINKAQQDVANDEGFQTSLLNVGKVISALRAVAVPIGGVIAGGLIGQVISAAAVLTKSLGMIPAVAAGAAAGIGTVSLATMGFGDAMKDIGDPEKFAEALQTLSPNAQQAALSIQAMLEPLTELKNATQDAFFEGGAEMINSLADQYLPVVERLTTGVASGLNDAMGSVFEQLMTPDTKELLVGAVDDIVLAFKNLAPAAGDFAGALAQIVATGSSFLPEMAEALARGAESFATLIDEAARSGDLQQFFRDGIDAVALFWEGLRELGSAFMDMGGEGTTAMSDLVDLIKGLTIVLPPVLKLLSDTVKPINEIANLTGAARDAMAGFRDVAEPVLKRVGELADWVSDKLQKMANLLPKWMTGSGIPSFLRPGGSQGVVVPREQMDATGAGGGGSFGGRVPGAAGSPPRRSTGKAGSPPRRSSRSGDNGSIFTIEEPPGTAGLPGVPPGGYPVPAPPADKGAGGGSKATEPPFSADPSLWSVDAIPVMPVDDLPTGLASPSGLTPNAANLNNIISSMFPMLPSAGGWRPPDGYNEHSAGEAVDFMVGENLALGDAINQFILDNAKALGVQYNIWRQAMWYPDGRVTPMEDRGSPTQNHFDHVHSRVFPGDATAGGIATGMGAGSYGVNVVDPEEVLRKEIALQNAEDDVEEKRLKLLELQSKGNASQQQLLTAENNVRQAEDKYRLAALELAKAREGDYKQLERSTASAAQSTANSLGQIGAALAGDFGLSEGLPGIAKWLTTFLANLAFAPMIGGLSAVSAASPIQGGHGMFGMMGAQNIAAGGSPLGLSMPATPGIGGPAMMGPAPLGGGLGPGLPTQHGANFAPPGPGNQVGAGLTSMSPSGSMGGGGFAGVGGLPLQAAMTATSALDMFAPGASQAAQTGIQLANRFAGYLGQLGAIGVGGLMETFLPNNSAAGDPSKSWVGRIASGVAGARPALPNTAGSAPAQAGSAKPEQQQATGGPMVNIENLNNNTNDSGQAVANTVARMTMSGYGAGGPR